MDSFDALKKVNDSFSDGVEVLDFSPYEITGECSPQIQEIVLLRKSRTITKEALKKTLLCLNNAGGLLILGIIAQNLYFTTCSINAYKKAISIFEKNENVFGLALSQFRLCVLYSNIGDWEKASKCGQESHTNYAKLGGNWYGEADLDLHWGIVLSKLGKWKDAILIFKQSCEKFEKRGDINGVASVYSGLSVLFFLMGDYKKSIDNCQKSLKIFEENNIYGGASGVFNNLGVTYTDMGDFENAIINYKKSLEQLDKLQDIDIKHVRAVTLTNMGRLYLKKKPLEPEEALKYLKESINIINKEIRPDYPNTIIFLALCYHRLGNKKKTDAKYEKDFKNKIDLVDLSSEFFSKASEYYNELLSLPRVILPPSIQMYAYLDKGLSLSVRIIIEPDEYKAITLLDNALTELKKTLNFADISENSWLQGIISDHEAKRYFICAANETDVKKQNFLLDKAIDSLAYAALQFERSEHGSSYTCAGCMHLYKGLKLFKEGTIKYNESKIKANISFNASSDELKKARSFYDLAGNEFGDNIVNIINRSFEYVETLIKSKDEVIIVSKAVNEFNNIIGELSSIWLQKMVKIYTFDESMNAKKEDDGERRGFVNLDVSGSAGDINIIAAPNGKINSNRTNSQITLQKDPEKSESFIDKFGYSATIAQFIAWLIGGFLLIFGYDQSNTISFVIGIFVFVFLAALKLKKLMKKSY